MITKISKPFYSEEEVAVDLGVSIEELRALVKKHIVKDGEMPEGGIVAFQASDLLLLKLLTSASLNSAV